MNTGEIVSITKIDKSKSPVSEPGDWETWDLGVANAHSLPISYQVLGVLLAPVKVGGRIHLFRLARNEVLATGIFTSTPIISIHGNSIETFNSIYRIENARIWI